MILLIIIMFIGLGLNLLFRLFIFPLIISFIFIVIVNYILIIRIDCVKIYWF